MKQYPLRRDTETVDICECGHIRTKHDYTFMDWIILRDNTGYCNVCTCPKYKKEKSMLLVDYLDRQNSSEVKE